MVHFDAKEETNVTRRLMIKDVDSQNNNYNNISTIAIVKKK